MSEKANAVTKEEESSEALTYLGSHNEVLHT